MPDLSHVRAGHQLYLRSIDADGNVKFTEVVAKGTRGKNLVLEVASGSFDRATGLMNGTPAFDYLPDARSYLVERTPETTALFEQSQAGSLTPVAPLTEAKLRRAVAWLKNEATYDQIVAVVNQDNLLEASSKA